MGIGDQQFRVEYEMERRREQVYGEHLTSGLAQIQASGLQRAALGAISCIENSKEDNLILLLED